MCMIEAAIGEPPFAFLDDDDVRAALKDGESPDQPQMSDDVWELVESMTHTDPAKRMKLPEVLEKLKVLAGAEEAAEKLRAAETHCSVCLSVIVVDALPTLDCTASVAVLLKTIATAGAAETEQAFLLLLRKCTDTQERLQMYEADGVRVLSDVVKTGGCYVAQLYALELLSWAMFVDSKLSKSEYEVLRDCIRSATTPELESMVDVLLHGTNQEKEDGLILCAALTTRGDGDAFLQIGVVPPLVDMLGSGSVLQQLWAIKALGTLAENNEANRVAIAREGAISPLVVLVSAGTDEQRRWAVYALAKLAVDEANHEAIMRDGAISPLVTLVKSGTDDQKQEAAYALGNLAVNEANQIMIESEGGISSLRPLARTGTVELKRLAADALKKLETSSRRWWQLRPLQPGKWQRPHKASTDWLSKLEHKL